MEITLEKCKIAILICFRTNLYNITFWALVHLFFRKKSFKTISFHFQLIFGSNGRTQIWKMTEKIIYIDNLKATSHSDPLFLKYKILKINDLVDFNQPIFMYKYTHKLLPASFENMFLKLGNFERSLNYQLDIFKMC